MFQIGFAVVTLITQACHGWKNDLRNPVVDTGQNLFFGKNGEILNENMDVSKSDDFYGQNANFVMHPFNYVVTNSIITDKTSKLNWLSNVPNQPMTYSDASKYCTDLKISEKPYLRWRLPNIHELGSLLQYG